eukprot:gene33049-40790_t
MFMPAGISSRSSTAPLFGSTRRISLSSPSQVACHSSPSTQVTPVTKRLELMLRMTAPVAGSTWWILRSRYWPTHRLPSAQVSPESPPWPGAGMEDSTLPVAGSILSMRSSAIWYRWVPSKAVPASQARSSVRVVSPLAGSKAISLAPVAAHTRWPSWVTHGTPAATQLVPAPGSPDSHPAIRAAISAASQAGGGRVLIPAGDWYCKGPIVLLSNVNVHLAAGARVHFSANPADYARDGDFDCGPNGKLVLSRWQGNDCLNYSPMVYARNQTNIALTGEDWTSILNGQGNVPFEDASAGGSGWWGWAARKPAGATARQNVTNEANPASLSALAPQLTPAELTAIRGTHADWRSDEKYLPALSEARVPAERRVFGIGHYLRPCMVEFVEALAREETAASYGGSTSSPAQGSRVAQLEAEVAQLRQDFSDLAAQFAEFKKQFE